LQRVSQKSSRLDLKFASKPEFVEEHK